jgi:protoporphyrinogen oxidase
MKTKPHVVILGAGPAGLGAAYRLVREDRAEVTVLERNPVVGGNAGSFCLAGLRVDYGSHRLHPACNPVVLHDIRALLGEDLLTRPRHGVIFLRGRWIHFPLKPLDLLVRLPPSFAGGVVRDALTKRWQPSTADSSDSFASVLERGLGRTICHEFYFPYARKIWGLEPSELAAVQARRRVSADSLPKMLGKVLASVPGLKPRHAGRFYYPRRGYGAIAEAYHEAARRGGACIELNAAVDSVETVGGAVDSVRYRVAGEARTIRADHVWSTIPVTALAQMLKPSLPGCRASTATALRYRAMILVYLVLPQPRFSEYDAHYFPDAGIPISRLSEPKNYSGSEEPPNTTVLCAELPCSPDDPVWDASDADLGQLVADALRAVGKPLHTRPTEVVTRRLRQAYPIYTRDYEVHLGRLERQLSQVDGLLTFGRQGLFTHDNTHHALYMAYCAAQCLGTDGRFDRARWEGFLQEFATHVVED